MNVNMLCCADFQSFIDSFINYRFELYFVSDYFCYVILLKYLLNTTV